MVNVTTAATSSAVGSHHRFPFRMWGAEVIRNAGGWDCEDAQRVVTRDMSRVMSGPCDIQ